MAGPQAETGPPTTGPPTTGTTIGAPMVDLTAVLAEAEQALRDPGTPSTAFATAARRQQLAYRAWSGHPEWDGVVLEGLPEDLRADAHTHVEARRLFLDMARRLSDTTPAWEIVEPRPADELLGYYREAEAATGIEWEYLAAINLVETGMGRIRGVSTAGAQGPMQFLPSTFEAWGEGGDIRDPHDAILAAGRFLAHHAGTTRDIAGALYRYNNHDNYVDAVMRYAELMRDDPRAYEALWHWEVQYLSTAGDLWLPVGYAAAEPRPAADYAAAHPERTYPVPPQVADLPPAD